MSRSGYSDDFDDALWLYRHTVDRAIEGPRGQKLLRDMVAALDAMKVKELEEDVFVSAYGCCALGAVAIARGEDEVGLQEVDPYELDYVGKLLDIPRSLAAEVAFENDCRSADTPAQRWSRMRNWAASQIVDRQETPKAPCSWCLKPFTLRYGVLNRHKHNGAPCPGAGKPGWETPQ